MDYHVWKRDLNGMSWRVTITFPELATDEASDRLHRVRNFGETIFRYFRDNGRGFISLAQVDQATRILIVEGIRNRDLKRTLETLKQMAEAEFPERPPEITANRT